MTFFDISPERWNELVHLTFFVFLCTLDKRHVYFLHLFLHLHQLCWSACVFFFYVYISSFYCLSSFHKVRTGIWSYLHSWEEVLNQLKQPWRNHTQLSLDKLVALMLEPEPEPEAQYWEMAALVESDTM